MESSRGDWLKDARIERSTNHAIFIGSSLHLFDADSVAMQRQSQVCADSVHGKQQCVKRGGLSGRCRQNYQPAMQQLRETPL